MATTTSSANLAAIFKDYYENPDVLGDVVYRKNKLLSILDNDTDLSGDYHKVPILSGYVQNSSGDGAVSFSPTTATASTVTAAFMIPPVSALNRAVINRRDNVMSRNDAGAFVKLATLQSDGLMKGRAAQTETELFREGWGDIGIIAAGGVSGSTFTLATPSDIVNFEVGQLLVFSDSQASDALRSGTPVRVTAVGSLKNPVVTVDTALATPGAVAGDWVFIFGCRENSATPTRLCVAGLGAFLPDSDTPGTLFGLDRNAYPSRYAGQYIAAGNANIKEAINTALAQCVWAGGDPDVVLMNTLTWGKLQSQTQTQAQYVNLRPEDKVRIGASGYQVNFDEAMANVVSSPKCPEGKIYVLSTSTWNFHTAEKPFSIFMDDETMIRISGQDAYEIRGGGYHSLYTNEPGHNAVITGFAA